MMSVGSMGPIWRLFYRILWWLGTVAHPCSPSMQGGNVKRITEFGPSLVKFCLRKANKTTQNKTKIPMKVNNQTSPNPKSTLPPKRLGQSLELPICNSVLKGKKRLSVTKSRLSKDLFCQSDVNRLLASNEYQQMATLPRAETLDTRHASPSWTKNTPPNCSGRVRVTTGPK